MLRDQIVFRFVLGMPPVVFLDEPSTGMDPVARRFMWTVIQDLTDRRKDCVIVLTTHSMDEAQALCERIAIQVDGSFRCLGTSQQIKDIHGSGYEVTVRLKTNFTKNLRKFTIFIMMAGNRL